MIISKNWLRELVDLKTSMEEVISLLPLRTIGIKEETEESFELDMKGYNRADLLSLRGVAYEVAAITNSEVKFNEPNEDTYAWAGKNLPKAKVEIQDAADCPFYCLAKIEGLKVDKSPDDWIKKLEQSGMRSVNNIADITNLVMLEYGQPLHAFDAATVADETIIVRTAGGGEKIVTLDNKIRELSPSDLLIADPEKPLGIAGVMGGKNSEISDSTETILLEAAVFAPITLRRTATKLGLQSEASKRFQHGLTKERLLQALDAAIKMYQQLGGKLTAITITGNFEDIVEVVKLRHQKLNSLVGIDIEADFATSSLKKLHFAVKSIGEEWETVAPYWRLDIAVEEDLIEEVTRMYGYEKIPAKLLPGEPPAKINQALFDFSYNLKLALVEVGFSEIQTYSFYSTEVLNNLNIDKNNLIKIANPMSKETEYMRDHLWPNLLRATAENLKYRDEVTLFEIGKIYQPQVKDYPVERYHLSVALATSDDNAIQQLFQAVSQALLGLKADIDLGSTQMEKEESELFHPVRFAKITHETREAGTVAEVHPRITNKFGVNKRVAILEVELEPLTPAADDVASD